ncbi:MAG: class I SAM-dependent methyltransferase [Acidiferrobacteraceae bacterium]
MAPSHLQYGFSAQHPGAVLDGSARRRKAEKIIRILMDQRPDLGSCRMLEIGCGAGHMSRHFARACREVVAVDIDSDALRVARTENASDNLHYALMDSGRHALGPAGFDIIVCNHVYEHVPDAEQLMAEIERLLAPGGLCFFGAGNRIAFMEPHYRLPLLSLGPKWFANRYLRAFRGVDRYYENHRTYWGLKALVSRFAVLDYTRRVIAEPARFAADDLLAPGSFRQRLASLMIRCCYWACPTYLWILKRR